MKIKILIEFNSEEIQLFNMVKNGIKILVARLLLGFLIYFLLINIIITLQFGSATITPVNWLLNPFYNLYPHTNFVAVGFLVGSLIIGYGLITKQRK